MRLEGVTGDQQEYLGIQVRDGRHNGTTSRGQQGPELGKALREHVVSQR